MGIEGWGKKPKAVSEAVKANDGSTLSKMGRSGAIITNEQRATRKEIEEIQTARLTESRANEELERARSGNEHIIDTNGTDLDYSDAEELDNL